MSFEAIPKELTREWYAERSLHKLPGDLLEACDQIRAQKKEINKLRADLILANQAKARLGIKNAALIAVLGGAAASGIEHGILALIKFFTH